MTESWIGVSSEDKKRLLGRFGALNGTFVYFRLRFRADAGSRLTADISANSRFKLWLNGIPVLSGPCKGDDANWYYDTVDLSRFLLDGENTIHAQVLYCSAREVTDMFGECVPVFSVMSPGGGHKFLFSGRLKNKEGVMQKNLGTGIAGWEYLAETGYRLVSDKNSRLLGSILEKFSMSGSFYDWMTNENDRWNTAAAYESLEGIRENRKCGILPLFRLKKRPIPLLYEREYKPLFCHAGDVRGKFNRSFYKLCPGTQGENEAALYIKAGEEIILDMGVIQNAYVRFCIAGGSGQKLEMTYFEKFVIPGRDVPRDEWRCGEIHGVTDEFELTQDTFVFEPFWFRTFRFIRLRISGGNTPICLQKFVLRKTGYDIGRKSWLKSSDNSVNYVWDICVRTMENCMMDTYMDCPFYEQLQYVMDARLEALYTYALSADSRLAKKAIEDFHCSILPDGLVQGRYPSAYSQVISTFSFHYIYMLAEYYEHTGDLSFVSRYIMDVDRILNYFSGKESDGLLKEIGYWEFVDWQEAWKKTEGSPGAVSEGASSLINLMYAYALEKAAFLYDQLMNPFQKEKYMRRHDRIVACVRKRCWDEKMQLFREGPDYNEFTYHTQSWFVLTGNMTEEENRSLLLKMMDSPGVLPCTFAASYELFRALEKTGMQEKIVGFLEKWKMLEWLGCTCTPEKPEFARSDCHGWSALPVYELVRVVAGIQRDGIGWNRVRVKPFLSGIEEMSGEIVTGSGVISYIYMKHGEKREYHIQLPPNMKGTLVISGREYKLKSGQNQVTGPA